MADTPEASELKKVFHVFISYRVATDAVLAERICDKLQQHTIGVHKVRVRCFLDKQNLQSGENWEAGFMNGLHSSVLFVPVMSAAGLAPMKGLDGNGKDNVLLEYETALGLRDSGLMEILPTLVGAYDDTRAYRRFGAWGGYPDVVSKTSNNGATVAATLQRLFAIQGVFLDPNDVSSAVTAIKDRLENWAWPRFVGMWHNKDDLDPEEQFECVQCGAMFTLSANGVGCCKFQNNSPWDNSRRSTALGRHRKEPHTDYRYTAYFEWALQTVGWKSNAEEYHKLTVDDYDAGSHVEVVVGMVKDGAQAGQLFVKVGSIESVHLLTPQAMASVAGSGWTGIGRNVLTEGPSPDQPVAFAQADWVLVTGADGAVSVSGIELRAKSASAAETSVVFVGIAPTTLACTGVQVRRNTNIIESLPVATVEASLALYDAATARPRALHAGTVNPDAWPQTAWTTRDARMVGDIPLRAKVTGPVVISAMESKFFDQVEVPLSLMNLSETKATTVVDVGARWRHVGAPAWIQLDNTKQSGVEQTDAFRVEADGVAALAMRVRIPDAVKAEQNIRWRAGWAVRFAPVEIELQFEAKDGTRGTVTVQAANHPGSAFDKPDSDAALHITADDVTTFDRYVAAVTIPSSPDASRVFSYKVGSHQIAMSLAAVRAVVHKAMATGVSVVEIHASAATNKEYRGRARVYIDRSSQRAYAIELAIATADSAAVGVCMLPMYGETAAVATSAPALAAVSPAELGAMLTVVARADAPAGSGGRLQAVMVPVAPGAVQVVAGHAGSAGGGTGASSGAGSAAVVFATAPAGGAAAVAGPASGTGALAPAAVDALAAILAKLDVIATRLGGHIPPAQ